MNNEEVFIFFASKRIFAWNFLSNLLAIEFPDSFHILSVTVGFEFGITVLED
jgi:hypothetical protein